MEQGNLICRPGAAHVSRRQAGRPVAHCIDAWKTASQNQFAPVPAGLPGGRAHDAGYQLDKVQRGDQTDDFKPMSAIGKGVEEIRVPDSSGA
jgi:hypothetical protein